MLSSIIHWGLCCTWSLYQGLISGLIIIKVSQGKSSWLLTLCASWVWCWRKTGPSGGAYDLSPWEACSLWIDLRVKDPRDLLLYKYVSEITNYLSLQLTVNHSAGLFPVASAKHRRLGTFTKKKKSLFNSFWSWSRLGTLWQRVSQMDKVTWHTGSQRNSESSDPQL